MAACDNTTQLYCTPAEGDTVVQNQTYALEFNDQFGLIDGVTTVDVYLYHADNSSLAEQFLNVPNNGEMTFTVEQV